jgi:Tfp pilus assembly protein PilO
MGGQRIENHIVYIIIAEERACRGRFAHFSRSRRRKKRFSFQDSMYRKIIWFADNEVIPLLVLSLAVVVSLAVFRFVAAPLARGAAACGLEGRSYAAMAADTARLLDVKKLLADKKGQLDRAYAQAASRDTFSDLPGLLQLLIAKAKDADIRFVKMQPQVDERGQKESGYPVVLEMTAPYSSLGRFVSMLEKLPRYLRVERIALTEGEKGLDIRILVTCFIRKEE